MKTDTLQTSFERVDKDRVKLRVEVPEDALAPAISAVYRRWSKEIRVPGFRKGKVPRQLIDARVGVGVVREEALRDALPHLYENALRVEDLEAIAPPEIEVVVFDAGSPLVFEATVDVRPEIVLPDIESIHVDAPSDEVTEEDIDEHIDRLRDRFAELESIGREARRGDFALIDLKAYQHDEPIQDASALDLLYEIGSRSGPPRLDEELEGSRPGAILKFNDAIPDGAGAPQELVGQDASFMVLVKEIKTKKLPAADDDFARTVGEFDGIDALKADLKARLVDVKREIAREQLRGLVLERFVEASALEPPETLVESEFKHQLEHFEADLASAGLSVDDYARRAEVTELEIRRDVRSQAMRSVKAELLLEEVARLQEINVSQEEIGREVAIAAARAEREAEEVAKQLVSSGRLPAVAADIMRRKALDYVVQHADVAGRPQLEESEDENESE